MSSELNFTALPCEIKSMIYKINREAERDEKYKDDYKKVSFEFHKSLAPAIIDYLKLIDFVRRDQKV